MPDAGDPILIETTPGYRVATQTATSDVTFDDDPEVSLISATASVVSGVTYGVYAFAGFASTVANDRATIMLRLTSTSGTQIASLQTGPLNTSGQGIPTPLYGEFTAASTGSQVVVLSAVRSVGSGTCRLECASDRPAYLYVVVVD